MKKINHLINKIDTPVWLEWLFAVVFILRIPSFFEPFSYGDEMIYLALGNGVREGLVLYKDLHDNKPPFLYFLAALAGNVFWFKVILAFWNLITIYFFWKLINHFFPDNKRLQKIATWAFALLTTLPLMEGNIANAELFFIGPIIAGFWILLSKPHTFKNLFISGILFSLAALFKIPAALDLGAILIYWMLTTKFTLENLANIAKKFSFVIIGFLVPIIMTFIWYYFRGALPEYWVAAFLQNIGYVSSFRPDDVQKPFLVKNLPMIIRAGLVCVGLFIVFLKRNKLSKQFVFTAIWLFISLFAVTLSERPYPHYLLQSAAPVSIFIGMFVAAKSIEQLYALIPLAVVLFIPVYYKYYRYDNYIYFERFVKLVTGQTTKQDYYNSFDKNVSRNYKLGEYLINSSTPKDRVFVWSDSASIYAISRRLPPMKYVAGYHINDFSNRQEVINILREKEPKFIIILPESENFKELDELVAEKYLMVEDIEGAEVWSLTNK